MINPHLSIRATANIQDKKILQSEIDRRTRAHDYLFTVEYWEGMGWIAVPDEPRYCGDQGVWLGRNLADSMKSIEELLS